VTFWNATDFVLLAQDGGNAPAAPSSMFMLMPLVLLGVFYIFIVYRPQRREQAERQAMLSNLKKNDHVLLNCGIFGVVTNIRSDADEVTVRVDESSNTKLRVTRASVARVIADEPADKTESASAG
jgi:preprotein translocase subunit YajC